jgi:hypothetical protein
MASLTMQSMYRVLVARMEVLWNTMLTSLVRDPPMTPSDVLVLINPHLHYFLWVEIPRFKGIYFN